MVSNSYWKTAKMSAQGQSSRTWQPGKKDQKLVWMVDFIGTYITAIVLFLPMKMWGKNSFILKRFHINGSSQWKGALSLKEI